MIFDGDTMLACKPRVSVGLPVYNGEAFVGAAIHSVLSQSYSCIELVISDNASADGTEAICRNISNSDTRVKYTRQRVNLGAARNFQWVFDHATGDYFMWMGADDVLSSSYIEDNIRILENTPNAVSSMTFLRDPGNTVRLPRREYISLDDLNPSQRISEYLRHPGTNDRFYSLHRKWALKKCLPLPNIVANDWLLVIRLLMLGPMICSPSNSFYNKAEGGASSSYRTLMCSYGKAGLSVIFPLIPFAIAICNEVPFKFSSHCFLVKHLLEISLLGQTRSFLIFRKWCLLIKSAIKTSASLIRQCG
jgi:glycosyltransferase involved in cell wall biosynthesis